MNREIFGIWLCKPGTISMPYIYEVCLATWQIMNPTFKVVLYTDNPKFCFNLLSRDTTEVRIIQDEFPGLITEAENIITDKTPEGMRFAQRSDYIRYTILRDRGGIYVDTDLLCYSSIEELVDGSNASVMMAYEYTNRICNAFMARLTDMGKTYFEDLLENYRKHYVKTSYTFNSIKYLYLLNRKHRDIVQVLPLQEGMFYPNWEDGPNGDLSMLFQEECPLRGYGIHLYNTNPKWREARDKLDLEFMETYPVSYKCDSSRDRVIKSLASLGKEDMDNIISDGKPVEVRCQFCNEAYEFSIDELKSFRRN